MASARQVVSTLRTFISCTYSPCASPEPQISDSLIADVLQPYHLREGSSPEVEDRRSGRPTKWKTDCEDERTNLLWWQLVFALAVPALPLDVGFFRVGTACAVGSVLT